MDAVPPLLGLGEVVLRVRDLDGMQRFYQDVLGLTVLRRFERMAFLKVGAGRAGHTTLHHFALEIPLADHDVWKSRLETHGLAVTVAEHPWVGWRSLYVADPEGNVVELVCYDHSLVR